MRIAVITPVFNVAHFVSKTILSVLAQSHADWLLIIVDDGSTDETAQVVKEFSDQRIHLLRQSNAGVSSARNAGIEHANRFGAKSLLFLDGDDWLAPDALQRLANTLLTAPNSIAACGRYARVSPQGTTYLSASPPHGSLLERLVIRNLFANGGHLLIRQKAITATGAFRCDLTYGEDWEYWTRLALLGDFVAVESSYPVLFVRERAGSTYLSQATDPKAYVPAMGAIHGNPSIARRLGAGRLSALRSRAEAETAWAVGRELIRHGRRKDGRIWLRRSIRNAPSLRRLALLALSWPQLGPFRRYGLGA